MQKPVAPVVGRTFIGADRETLLPFGFTGKMIDERHVGSF
jgi:hypothetical protein